MSLTEGIYIVGNTDDSYTVILGRNTNYIQVRSFDRESSKTGYRCGRVSTKSSPGVYPGGWVSKFQVSPSLEGNPIVRPGQRYHGDKVLFENSPAYMILAMDSVPAWVEITTSKGNEVRLFAATPRKDNNLRITSNCVFCFDKPNATMRIDFGYHAWFFVYSGRLRAIERMDAEMFSKNYPNIVDGEWVPIR